MTSPWPVCVHDADPTTCDACYAEDAHEAARPVVSLADALAELEAADPTVAEAAAKLRQVTQEIIRRGRINEVRVEWQ